MRINVGDHERLKITIFGRGTIFKSFVNDLNDFLNFRSKHPLQYNNQGILRMLQNFYIRYNCLSMRQGLHYAFLI